MDHMDNNEEQKRLFDEIRGMTGGPEDDGAKPLPDDAGGFVKPRKDFKLHLSEDALNNPGGEAPIEEFASHGRSPAARGGDGKAASGPARKKVKVKRRGCLNALIYTAVLIVLSVFLALFIIAGANDAYAIMKSDEKISVTIPANPTVDKVSAILQDDGVISYGFLFSLYTKAEKVSKLQQGTFTLNSNMSYSEIIAQLRVVPGARQVVRVTIPEGYTLLQIADTLEKKKVCGRQEFLDACDSKSIKFDFSSQVPDDKNRFYRLEGYAFPDTYDFYVGSAPSEVLDKMLANFDGKFDADLQDQAKAMKMTVDQVVTLASIIQVESSDVKEMANVSSVFHNRLEKGSGSMKYLQSDATIFYIKKDINTVLKKSDTEIDSPHNTYKHPLLPPGAICNPGLDAIKAALYPANTKYYYFVTDKKNKYYFAETYTEHLANVSKAMKVGDAKGTGVVN